MAHRWVCGWVGCGDVRPSIAVLRPNVFCLRVVMNGYGVRVDSQAKEVDDG